MMKNIFPVLLIILALACSKKQDSPIVAKVNGEQILLSELEYSLNFFPQYAPSKRGADVVKAHLSLLIEKKLFSQEGRRHGFHKSEHVQKVINWVERDEMLKALYAEEIRGKVSITEEEIQQRHVKGLESVKVRHLFVPTKEQAMELKRQLQNGAEFEDLAAQTFSDPVLRKNGGDLGFLTFDQMDPVFAEVAFSLENGQISNPVRTKWGYHIIRVDERRKMVFADQSTLEEMRTKIERDILREKEKQRGSEFVGNYMRPLNVQMINSSFGTLGAELQKVVIGATQQVSNYQPILGGKEIQLLSNGINSYYDLPLITFEGGEWTIEDFMEKLKTLPVTKRPRMENPIQFRQDIGRLVRDEFMYEEAKKRGYDKLPQVKAEVKKWQDDFTFSEYWQTARDTIRVKAIEVQEYFSKHQGRYVMPETVHIQEILVSTLEEVNEILKKLNAGTDFGKLASEHSLRSWAAKKNGDLGWVKSGDYGNSSTKGFEIENGEIGGPFQVPEGFVIIKRLGYRAARPMNLKEAEPFAFENARTQKQREYYSKLKQQLLKETEIEINEELIQQLANEIGEGNQIQMPGLREEQVQ
jgi:parvulin-like peptidyl-prolyl isomerase